MPVHHHRLRCRPGRNRGSANSNGTTAKSRFQPIHQELAASTPVQSSAGRASGRPSSTGQGRGGHGRDGGNLSADEGSLLAQATSPHPPLVRNTTVAIIPFGISIRPLAPWGEGIAPIAHRPSPIAHRPSPIAHRPSPIAHRPSPIAHRPSPTVSPGHGVRRPPPAAARRPVPAGDPGGSGLPAVLAHTRPRWASLGAPAVASGTGRVAAWSDGGERRPGQVGAAGERGEQLELSLSVLAPVRHVSRAAG